MYGQHLRRLTARQLLKPQRTAQSSLHVSVGQRTMSTDAQAPARHKFIVYAPDMSDAGALQRRLSVRPAHLEKAAEYIEGGMFSKCDFGACDSLVVRQADGVTHLRGGGRDAKSRIHRVSHGGEEDGRVHVYLRGRES